MWRNGGFGGWGGRGRDLFDEMPERGGVVFDLEGREREVMVEDVSGRGREGSVWEAFFGAS